MNDSWVEWFALVLSAAAIALSAFTWRRTHQMEVVRDEERRAAERAARLVPDVVRSGNGYALKITNLGPSEARDVELFWDDSAVYGSPYFMNPPDKLEVLAPGASYSIRVHLEALPRAETRAGLVTMRFVDRAGEAQQVKSAVSF